MIPILHRFLRAFRFGQSQVTANAFMVPALLLALAMREDASQIPWWMYVAVGLIYPTISFLSNFFDPLP